ncbi:MAG: phosphatidylglycerophosphatase A [Alphaproteobacteria bacterium]
MIGRKKLNHWIVTVGGMGHWPYAPGTWGSLVGLVLGAGVHHVSTHPFWLLMGLIGALSLLSLYAISHYLKNHPGKKDPSEIVIDEVVGQLVAVLVCETPLEMGLAFLLFRVFDIWKPWPVSWADEMGGTPTKDTVGIMLDDVLAGFLAAGGVLILQSFYQNHPTLF